MLPPCNHFSYPNLLSTFANPPNRRKTLSTFANPDELQSLSQQWLMEHHRLRHPSQKRQAALEVDGLTKPKVPKLACPTCLASKARKSNRPTASTKKDRSTVPSEDIHSDLSCKISTQSARGYFAAEVAVDVLRWDR